MGRLQSRPPTRNLEEQVEDFTLGGTDGILAVGYLPWWGAVGEGEGRERREGSREVVR